MNQAGQLRTSKGDTMDHKLEQLERELLLEGIFQRYGYDFRDYATGSLSRRIREAVNKEGLSSISALQDRVLHDRDGMQRFIGTLAIHVTAMFRDPGFYRDFRTNVVPILKTYPFVRVWIAGCSSGEEVYSTAIVLAEEGIYDRCRIYATDLSDAVLQRAEAGIFPLSSIKDYTRNYQQAGGVEDFSSYYTAKYENAIFSKALRKNITYSQHSLTTDGSFNEFNVVLCRNVMIYFSKTLQQRVLQLLDESLCRFGVLGLGRKESLRFSGLEQHYKELPDRQRLYRRLQ